MRHLIATFILFALVSEVAYAKRIPAPKVVPVVHDGVRYVAPNDNGRRGYIQAWEATTNKLLWSVTVFRKLINPFLEEDVQWVYITTLRLEDGKLIVIDERERAYSVDLKTHAVRRLRRIPLAKQRPTIRCTEPPLSVSVWRLQILWTLDSLPAPASRGGR